MILLAEHGADSGAYGLVLNRPTGKIVGDFLQDKSFSPLSQLTVHEGGPVAMDQLTFTSFWWSKKLGLRWASRLSVEVAVEHAHKPGRIVRAFIGHSGWSPGQLENELQHQSWIPIRAKPNFLGLAHDTQLWAQLMHDLSPLHRILAEAPAHPELN